MFRNLFGSSPGGGAAGGASKLAPHRTEIEFVLVLVEAPADQQLEYTIKLVTDSAVGCGGTVLQILGSLIFVGFSGVVGCAPRAQRQAFVIHVCSTYKLFVKVLHGRASALVGVVGGDSRVAYTAIPDHFGSILEQLSGLSPGEAVEHGTRQTAEPGSGNL